MCPKGTDMFTLCNISWQSIPQSRGSNTKSAIPKEAVMLILLTWNTSLLIRR